MANKITEYFNEHPIQKQMWLGSIYGALVRAMATPLTNWNNLVLRLHQRGKSTKFQKKHLFNPSMMDGATGNAISAIPTYTAAFGLRTLFKEYYTPGTWSEFVGVFMAGMAAGVLSTPFELLVQARLETKSTSTRKTLTTVILSNTPQALLRGANIIAFREGAWLTSYMAMLPLISGELQKQGLGKVESDAGSAVISGGTFGFFTAWVNTMRFERQSHAATPSCPPPYPLIVKKLWIKDGVMGFFKGAVPRSVHTSFTAFALNALINSRPEP